MNKYSISSSNLSENNSLIFEGFDGRLNETIEDMTMKKDMSYSVNNIQNFPHIIKEKSPDLKLPFKVIREKEIKSVNNSNDCMMNLKSIINKDYLKNFKNNFVYNDNNINLNNKNNFDVNIFESNINNFINLLSKQNKYISSLGNIFTQIYQKFANETNFEKQVNDI